MSTQNRFWDKIRGFSISHNNHLMLNGVNLVDLAKLSDYPIYVLNELAIRENIHAYNDSLSRFYPKSSSIYYASKVFLNLAMSHLIRQEGIGIDVCSEGELFIAQEAKIPSDRIIMHGNNKSERELTKAVESQIHRVVVDSYDELVLLEKICTKLKKTCEILIRINPSVKVKTHKYISTGIKESKFGFYTDQARVPEYLKTVCASGYIVFRGIHFHIGSNIYDLENFIDAINVIVDYLVFLKENNIEVENLNVGGGLGIAYMETDIAPSIPFFVEQVCKKIVKSCHENGLVLPHLMMEPGRSIVGQAGCTIYKVGSIKEGHNGVLYAAVNGGMSDNMRPALYQAEYTAAIANKMNSEERKYLYKIVGKCCETGDVLIENITLPACEAGDVLVVFCTGAYHHSIANSFNKLMIPGMIFVKDKKFSWIAREQNFEDIIACDILPNYLIENQK